MCRAEGPRLGRAVRSQCGSNRQSEKKSRKCVRAVLFVGKHIFVFGVNVISFQRCSIVTRTPVTRTSRRVSITGRAKKSHGNIS